MESQSVYIEKYYQNIPSYLEPFIPKNASFILDVGCASGGLAYLLDEMKINCELWGVEPNSDAAESAKSKYHKILNQLFTEKVDLPRDYFDLIFFNDVLEHLENPLAALMTASKFLKQDGLIICSIPHIRHYSVVYEILVKKDFQYRPSGILDKTHLRFFAKNSIIRMFEDANLRIKELVPICRTYPFSSKLKPLYKMIGYIAGDDIFCTNYAVVAGKNKC